MTVLEKLFVGQDDLDLLNGSIVRSLVVLALPVVASNLIQTSYTVVDTFWLGQYSTTALAAISLSYPLGFLILAVAMGLPTAGSILVSQAIGADNDERSGYAVAQILTHSLLFSLVVGIIGFFAVDDLLTLFDIGPDVYRQSVIYIQLYALGLPATVCLLDFAAIMRGTGDTVTPMMVLVGTVFVNISLDPVLIFGWSIIPELGILGASLATVGARVLGSLVGLWILLGSSRGFDIYLDDFRPDLEWAREIARTGAPTSLETSGRAISSSLLLFVVGMFSTAVIAGYGVGLRILSLAFLATAGAASAVETMTGQNIGAGNIWRVKRTNHVASVLIFVVMTAIAVVCWVYARPMLRLFSSDPEVLDVGVTVLRWVAPTFGFMGVMRTFLSGFRGAGKTAIAAAIVLSVLGLFRVGAAWFGAQNVGPVGVWAALGLSNVVGAALAYLWFRRGTWQDGMIEKVVKSDDGTENVTEEGRAE